MAIATVTVTGTICKADGTPSEGSHVRAVVKSTLDDQGGQVAGSAGISSEQAEAYTNATGFFSIDLVAGAIVLLEIPDVNLSKEVQLPGGGSVDFISLI